MAERPVAARAVMTWLGQNAGCPCVMSCRTDPFREVETSSPRCT
jgi:hypothetical protein